MVVGANRTMTFAVTVTFPPSWDGAEVAEELADVVNGITEDTPLLIGAITWPVPSTTGRWP